MADHHFGGAHTDDKLRRLRDYLTAFSTALKDQGFVRVYIDAFAGTGSRAQVSPALPLFGDELEVMTVPGSARIALDIEPPFDVLCLIENDETRFAALGELVKQYPHPKIHPHKGDANDAVRRLCERLPWHGSRDVPRGMRGVMFLDPYGMEVEWATVEAIAKTGAIDVWYFFPLMGLYRQAAKDLSALSPDKEARLTRVLGTDDWKTAWYEPPVGQSDLFEDPVTAARSANVDAIETYVKTRLESVFRGGVLSPLRIFNGRGAPIASLFFAVSNPSPRAADLAKRIARHILSSGQPSHRRPR